MAALAPQARGRCFTPATRPCSPMHPSAKSTHLWALLRHQRQAQLAALRPLAGHNFLLSGNQYQEGRRSGQLQVSSGSCAGWLSKVGPTRCKPGVALVRDAASEVPKRHIRLDFKLQ